MYMCELLFHTQMLHFHLISKGLGNLSGQVTAKSLSSIKREDQSLWCFAQNTYPLPPHPRRGARFQTRHVNGGIFFWNSSRGGQNGGEGQYFAVVQLGELVKVGQFSSIFSCKNNLSRPSLYITKFLKFSGGKQRGRGMIFDLNLVGGGFGGNYDFWYSRTTWKTCCRKTISLSKTVSHG